MRRLLATTLLIVLPVFHASADLINIDFEGFAPFGGTFSGGVEDGVNIATSGSTPNIFGDSGFGTGNFALSNNCCTSSTTWDFTLLSGDTFTFESFDLGGWFGANGDNVSVAGFLGGVLQDTDSYTTSASPASGSWVTEQAVNLSGIQLDQLSITLFNDRSFPTMDNIMLNTGAVPSPATLAIFGLGLLMLGFRRKRII